MDTEKKIARAIEILESQGIEWTMDIADAVHRRARTCDGKDSAAKIAAYVKKEIAAA